MAWKSWAFACVAVAVGTPLLILAVAPAPGASVAMRAAHAAWRASLADGSAVSVMASDSGDAATLGALAAAGDGEAAIALAELRCAAGDPAAAVDLLVAAADNLHPVAMAELIVLAGPGVGRRADLAAASGLTRVLVGTLADPDLARIARRFARDSACVASGDRELASAFVSAVFDELPYGQAILAEWYDSGRSVPRDAGEAYALAGVAADLLDPDDPTRARMMRIRTTAEAELLAAELRAAIARGADWAALRPRWRQ